MSITSNYKKAVIKADATSKTYYFDKTTYFKAVGRNWQKLNSLYWGPIDLHFSSPSTTYFARYKNPLDIYSTDKKDRYVMTAHFDKVFPFIRKDRPNSIIYSCPTFEDYQFNWRKEGKTIIELKHKSEGLFSDEELFYASDPDDNHLELFASMIYLLFYYPSHEPGQP